MKAFRCKGERGSFQRLTTGREQEIQSYGHTGRTLNSAFTSTHYFWEIPTLRKLSMKLARN